MVLREQLKSRSEAAIRAWELSVNPNLPLIEGEDELCLRSAQEVGIRLYTLGYVVGFYYTDDAARLEQDLKQFKLFEHLSPAERELFHRKVTKQDKINCSWLEEGAVALAWCLGLLPMDPFVPVSPELGEKVALGSDPHALIGTYQLRPLEELMAAADLYYRLHWAARQLGYSHPKLSLSLVMERRRALDWVLGVDEWDEIPLDT